MEKGDKVGRVIIVSRWLQQLVGSGAWVTLLWAAGGVELEGGRPFFSIQAGRGALRLPERRSRRGRRVRFLFRQHPHRCRKL